MADNRTMKVLLQAPTEGYGEAIVISEINADHFEIKTNLLQLVQANPYHGFERENLHTHINNFKRITSNLKFKDVPNDVIKLMMFPYSLKGAARVWYDKEPPNSILNWEDLVNKFVNQFFPPSKTTHLKNEISRFTQRFEETFGEACERFKEMLRACPHHGFTELTQIDTFYNGLNENDQDSLNVAAGGNLLSKTTREALHIIENKSKVRYSKNKSNVFRMNTTFRESSSKMDDRIDKLADQISTLVDIFSKKVVTPTTVKAVEESWVTCGGNHAYYNCDATNSNQSSVCAATGFQNQHFQVLNNQVQQGFSNDFSNYKKANDQMMRNMQSQINSLNGEFKNEIQNTMKTQQTVLMEQQNAFQNNFQNMLSGFFQNQSSTLGTLSSNTILNPKSEMKAITTRSGIAYEGHSIPTPKKVVERETEDTTNKEQTNFQGFTAHTQPSIIPILEPDVPKTLPKPDIPYPSRLNDQKLREKAMNQMEKFFQIFQDLHFDISFADALLLMPKFTSMIKSLLANEDKMDVCQALADLGASINLMPLFIWKKLSLPELTPISMTLELADQSITRPKGVAEDVFVKVGKFHFLADFVVVDFEVDPRVPLILGRSFLRIGRALTDVYGEEITLRVNDEAVTFNLNQTTRYLSTYDDMSVNRIDVIDVSREDDPEGDICLIEKLLNDDPFQLPPMDLKQGEVVKAKSSIEEPPELELKDLPSHLKYAYLEGVNKLPMIIAKDLKDDEKEALLKVLKSHKRAIAWKITDIKGIDPCFCTYKILMEEDYKPAVQSQRRVNPKIHEVIKKEVDRAKVDVIAKLPHPTTMKGVRIFLGHDGFYRSDFAIGAVLGQRKTKHFQPIHYASKTMTEAQIHYTTTEKQMLAVVYAFEKFQPYLVLSKSIVYTDHSALKYLLSKKDAKPRLLRWVLLLQEFDIIIRNKKGTENLTANHLSRLENPHKDVFENKDINENFLLETLGVTHHLATAYHPQIIGHVEVSNRGSKRILERTVEENRASWSEKLEDALWAFRTTYKTPIGCTPYKLVYEKSCHLPIELEHKAYWALKHANSDLKTVGDHRKLQLNELNELRDQAYENSLIYKEKTKKLHDSKIKNRIFNVVDRVLLFNSCLKIFSGMLKTRWLGTFTITKAFPYGTVELSQPEGPNFKVNGHRVKHYFRGDIPQLVVLDLQTFLMDK
uniref:Reverse transcriptase domain-containing protein n=1 Tax=Tanacetum cinerariifolium TaxID=118510 RepID=A0A6L2N5R0_TANCI|nr:reverse transcriptase domain-containing protein [Tanacetum cinerariifolium]